jgi:hypothetical protein
MQESKYSSTVFVQVDQVISRVVLRDPAQLARGIPNPALNPAEFYRRCGNAAIIAASRGGTYTALVHVETDSADKQSTLDTNLSAAIGGFGGSAAANVSQDIASSNAHTNATQSMSGVVVPIPNNDAPSVLAFALQYPVTVAHNAAYNTYTDFEETPYDQLLSISELGGATTAELYLDAIADRYEQVARLRGSLDFISKHPGEFSPRAVPPAGSDARLSALATDLRQRALACANDPKHCSGTIPNLPLDIRLPERVIWYPANGSPMSTFDSFVKSFAFQPIGTVPPGQFRVLEERGVWYCGAPSCPQSAFQYQVVDSNGAVVESGTVGNGTKLITHSGQVRVRANDGPGVPEFNDNTADSGQPPQLALW